MSVLSRLRSLLPAARRYLGQRRYLDAGRPASVLAGGNPVREVRLTVKGRNVVLQADESLDLLIMVREVFVERHYCPPDLPFEIRPNDVVFDIGANVGAFALLAAVYTTNKVVALEPVPSNYELLRRNVSNNGMRNVHLMRVAVSDQPKTVEMLLFDGEMFGCRIPSPHVDRCGQDLKTIEVDCIPLAQAMEAQDVDRIDFLKLDCEGEEFAILRALEPAILDGIRVIALEYHDNLGRGLSGGLARQLAERGFTVRIRRQDTALGYLYAWRDS